MPAVATLDIYITPVPISFFCSHLKLCPCYQLAFKGARVHSIAGHSAHFATTPIYSHDYPCIQAVNPESIASYTRTFLSRCRYVKCVHILFCLMFHVQRPHVRLQKLPLVMKDSLHFSKDFCKGKQAVTYLQSGKVHAGASPQLCFFTLWSFV